jgi:hypothetical protein
MAAGVKAAAFAALLRVTLLTFPALGLAPRSVLAFAERSILSLLM